MNTHVEAFGTCCMLAARLRLHGFSPVFLATPRSSALLGMTCCGGQYTGTLRGFASTH